jgi:hypothetical protein
MVWFERFDPRGKLLRLTAADIRGHKAISYMRYSSPGQGRAGTSTEERQQDVLDDVLGHFGLVLDQSIVDRAKSASKGHHRTIGKLGELLELADDGLIEPGTILIVETYDRLFREGWLDVAAMLKKLVDAGIIILTGRDMAIWCKVSIEEDNHKLLSEINSAKRYTDRLAELAVGGHKNRRKKLLAHVADPSLPLPKNSGAVPGWFIRLPNSSFDRHPVNYPTIRRICEEAMRGVTSRTIAADLNARQVPTFGGAKEWRAPRIREILQDRHLLGYYTPKVRENGKKVTTKEIGEVKAFPPAVTIEEWDAIREAMGRRQYLTGRKGALVANIFTKHVFCGTCQGALRAYTGGRPKADGSQNRILVCANFTEAGSCKDRTRYDLRHYEPLLLGAIMRMTSLAPPRRVEVGALETTLATLRDKLVGDEKRRGILLGMLGSSDTIQRDYQQLVVDIDRKKVRIAELAREIDSAATAGSRWEDSMRFIRDAAQPALAGDPDARDRLRGLLARYDYGVVGRAPGMVVICGDQEVTIDPPDFIRPQDEPDHGDDADAEAA